jgi:cell division protease FtsH
MMSRSGVGGDKTVMKFGKARTRLASEEKKKVTFADVAGAEEEKEELREIVDFSGAAEIHLTGRENPQGRAARRPSGHR